MKGGKKKIYVKMLWLDLLVSLRSIIARKRLATLDAAGGRTSISSWT
jgi:hypothetical protein